MTTATTAKVKRGFRKGDTIGVRKLRNAYDRYAVSVLFETGRIDLPASRGARRAYEIVADLPTKAEYEALKKKVFTKTAAELLEGASDTILDLSEEMSMWHDSLPENLQNSDRANRIYEAAMTLGNFDRLEVPESAKSIGVFFLPMLRDSWPRQAKLDEALAEMNEVAKALSDAFPDDEEISSLTDDLFGWVDELSGVEFPGMYD